MRKLFIIGIIIKRHFMRKSPFEIEFLLKVAFIHLVLIFVSCSSSDENENMEVQDPDPINLQYSISIVSDRQGEVYNAYKGGKSLAFGTTTNDSKTAKLVFTQDKYNDLSSLANKSLGQSVELDSIVGKFSNKKIYMESNRTVDIGSNNIEVINNKLLYSHVIRLWSNARPLVTGFDKGQFIGSGYSQTDPLGNEAGLTEIPFFNDENTTTIDSIIATYDSSNFEDWKIFNVQIKDTLTYVDPIGGELGHLFIPKSENNRGLGYYEIRPLRNGNPEFSFAVFPIDDDSTEFPWEGDNAWYGAFYDRPVSAIYISGIFEEPRNIELAFYDLGDDGDFMTQGDSEWSPFTISVDAYLGNNGVLDVQID